MTNQVQLELVSIYWLQENFQKHKKATVSGGGPFKNGKYHKEFFDRNPFLTEKDGPTYKERKRSKSEGDLKPFKPSSPPKKVHKLQSFKSLVKVWLTAFNFCSVDWQQQGRLLHQVSKSFRRSLQTDNRLQALETHCQQQWQAVHASARSEIG